MKPRGAGFLVVLFSLLLCAFSYSQQSPRDVGKVPIPEMSPETRAIRDQATSLYQQNKFAEAIPLFEKVLKEVPKDVVCQERLARAVLQHADQLADPELRKAGRIRARKEFLRAKELGSTSDLTSVMVASLPEDGHDARFSQDAKVDELMHKGERAFGARDYAEAKRAYKEALDHAPKLYEAALFLGDLYLQTQEFDLAGEYFQKAITINPQKETAYRYWGDTLLKEGKLATARAKFIDAVIASPYTPQVWSGINNYLRAVNKPARFPRITPPVKMTSNGKGGLTVTLASQPEVQSALWMAYPMIRGTWQGERFAKEYPNEKQYRHSLREEVEALSTVVTTAEASAGSGEKLNQGLAFLVELRKAGLLEPYVLLNVPDQGIIKDYEQFRKEHRDVLLRYLSDIVLPPPPADAK